MPVSPTSPARVLAIAVADNPSRPFLTYYDDATGERTELSLTTFENWVAKTANLLRDGLGLEQGARVAVRLPLHWQSAVWHAACWVTGAVALPAPVGAPLPPGLGADVLVTESVDLSRPSGPVPPSEPAAPGAAGAPRQPSEPLGPDGPWAGSREVVALGLLPLARPGVPVPPPAIDYDAEVPGYGDRFSGDVVAPDAPALVEADRTISGAELVEAARQAVARWELGTQDRVLVVEALDGARGVVAGLLAPLLAGSSVVLCRRPDKQLLPDRVVRERVTAVVGSGLSTPASGSASASPPSPRMLA